jgi:predicted nuclease of predicted toxin-antitoxin system
VPDLRFLADMNISPMTVQELKERGWNIVRVAEALNANAKDEDILSYARGNNMVLITQDLDFSALLAIGGYAGPSVISLRLEEPHPMLVARRLVDVVSEIIGPLKQGIVVSVDEASARYRNLPIDSENE